MADKPDKSNKLRARLPRGLADRGPAEIAATRRMLETIRAVYERYGFEPVETPTIEYTDALGKFLPDQDRPNEGVFSFQDDDEQWLSLRYDLTAPLARYVAENFDALPKPYRSYREGWVFRNEKPGPGRFRQFMQFDADTVGSASPAADAEICMMAADTMEALGIPRGSYVVKVNNRKVLDGALESMGLGGEANASKRLDVMRVIDKSDRFGEYDVRLLLGPGRRDESGDFTKGAGLNNDQISAVLNIVGGQASSWPAIFPDTVLPTNDEMIRSKQALLAGLPTEAWEAAPDRYYYSNEHLVSRWRAYVKDSEVGKRGISEIEQILSLVQAAGYGSKRIQISSSVVRGLEYYTGPVYEVELAFPIEGEDGKPVRFGSVGGGGRYDGLIARFRGEPVPAAGFSIGVSRLMAALQHLGKIATEPEPGPVVVTVFDRERIADYQKMVASLRNAGIRAELYLGSGRMGPQLKYADRRGSPCVVIQGGDEKAKGEVQIKDLIEGAKAAAAIASNQEWRASRPAQFAVPEDKLVDAVRDVLARHDVTWGARRGGRGEVSPNKGSQSTGITQAFRARHEAQLIEALREMVPLSTALAEPQPEHEQIIGTAVDDAIFDLNSALIHLQQHEPGMLNLGNTTDRIFTNYLASLHRKFYSDLVTSIEAACSKLVAARSSPRVGGGNPHFMDHVNAALATSKLTNAQKTHWRNFFECLRILRNKSSHYDTSFRQDEQQLLNSSGLGHHINAAGSLHSNVRNYRPLIDQTVAFLRMVNDEPTATSGRDR